MSAKSNQSQESGDNAEGQTKDHVYDGIVFDSGVKHAARSLANEGTLVVKKRHLIVGVLIHLVVMIALIVVGGYVVYNMSKCQECLPQPPTEESEETKQQTQADTIGYASGSHYKNTGGTSHTICLPRDPQHDKHYVGEGEFLGYLYNAEYEITPQTQAIFGEDIHNQDVPCAVCEVKGRSAILMIPARMECYDGWKKEYSGYLMTEYHTHYRSSMKCVDKNPEKIHGQSGNNDGELFYFVEPAGTIPDPPYTRGVELTCVVCTK